MHQSGGGDDEIRLGKGVACFPSSSQAAIILCCRRDAVSYNGRKMTFADPGGRCDAYRSETS